MKPEISDAAAWYVRSVFEAWLREHPEEKPADLARAADLSKPTVNNILSGTRAGIRARDAAAQLLGIEPTAFEKRATAEHKKHGGSPKIEYDERYPNRGAVLELLRPELHPETVKRIEQGGAFASESDMTRREWIAEFEALDNRVRREIASPATAATERAAKRKRVQDTLDDESK